MLIGPKNLGVTLIAAWLFFSGQVKLT